MVLLQILLLILIANGAPILARNIFGNRYLQPLDGGLILSDGRPLFGPSKTLLGLGASLAITTIAAGLLGLPPAIGFLIAAAAMSGDLISSYIKRRLGRPCSSYAAGLDQIPEALLPSLLLMPLLNLRPAEVVLLVASFVALELGLSALLYRLRVRRQPY